LDPRYGERYREVYEKHWWWRARTELIVGTVRRLQPAQGWSNILDIGCGDALFFDRLSEFGDVEGVEPFADLVNSNNPHRSRIHVRPFDRNFQPGKHFSLILMLDVLEHLEHPIAALRHVADLLSPNGTFIATLPAFMELWTNHDVLNHHFTRYTKSSFRDLARQTGLTIQEERYLYHWACLPKLILGVLERTLHLEPKPPNIPARWVNEALYWLSRTEQMTLSTLPMPFGSSLTVVATKGEESLIPTG